MWQLNIKNNRHFLVSSKLNSYVHYRLFFHQADKPASSFILNEASFVHLSCISNESATAASQSVNGITWFYFICEPYHALCFDLAYVQKSCFSSVATETPEISHIDGRRQVYINATAHVLPASDSTFEKMTTRSTSYVHNQTKKVIYSDEKKEQINAKRRAAYRKKKDEESEKLHHEYQSSISMFGMFLWLLISISNH